VEKRLLIYTNHFDPEHFKINEAVDWLIESGFQVHVITGWPNYPKGKIYKGYGPFKKSFESRKRLTIRRLPLIPRGEGSKLGLIFNYLSYFASTFFYTLFLILFKKKFDRILVHHTSPFFISISAVIYKKIKGIEAVLWDLDLWPETLEAVGIIKSKFWINQIEKVVSRIYSNFETILVGSYSFKKVALGRVKHKRVFYFPNWAEKVIEKNKIKAVEVETKFDSKALKIMYTGNIGTAQDFKTLCEVIKLNEKENIQWIFIGEGRFKLEMQRFLLRQINKRRVVFIPQQKLESIPSWAGKADFMYLSLNHSRLFTQTVPAKLQAYMAMGKPILAMIAGEGESIINQAKCGYCSPPGDLNKLNEIIKKLAILSKEDRKNLGENGRYFYKKNFSSKIRKKQLTEYFEK
tara:strand:- start:6 stop:1223 length:1218 start_codon:yes stop_codon:yes gene_type:complete